MSLWPTHNLTEVLCYISQIFFYPWRKQENKQGRKDPFQLTVSEVLVCDRLLPPLLLGPC